MKSRYILECPHCHNTTPHKLLAKHLYIENLYDSYGEAQEVLVIQYYLICKICCNSSLYGAYTWDTGTHIQDTWEDRTLLYPNDKELPHYVPTKLQKMYTDLDRLEKTPDMFAVKIRKAFEFICEDKGAKGKNLKEQIENLAKVTVLPETFRQIAHKVRDVGNIGAHGKGEDVKVPDTWLLKSLLLSVINYLYVAPEKIRSADKLKKEGWRGLV